MSFLENGARIKDSLSFSSPSIEGSPGAVTHQQIASHFPSLPMVLPLWLRSPEQEWRLGGSSRAGKEHDEDW
jgi:hypothetical protein